MVALRDEDGDGDRFAGEGHSGSFRGGYGGFGCALAARCDAAMGKNAKGG
jgi:hypothetical protein